LENFPNYKACMGKYYATALGEEASVAAACEEHYKPLGPTDRVPTEQVSVAVALADKLDTLVGFLGCQREANGEQGSLCAQASSLGNYSNFAGK